MRKTETRVIDGVEYRVTQFGALEGRKVLLRLLKAVGPLFAAFAELKGEGEGKLKDAIPHLDSALNGLKEEDLEYLCDVFARCTEVKLNGKWPNLPDVFDLHFTGKYISMFAWLKFCVEVNFSDFFQLATRKREALSAVAEATESA